MATIAMEDYFGGVREVYEILDEAGVNTGAGIGKILYGDAAMVLAVCINTFGYIHVPWMLEASGMLPEKLLEALEGTVFQDPETYDRTKSDIEGWQLRARYLSGNIVKKLEAAEKMNRKYGGRFDTNVQALKQNLPPAVRLEEIGINIGSSWVPPYYYSRFAGEILSLPCCPEVSYSADLGMWKVQTPDGARSSFHNNVTFGTRKMTALKILEHTLNAGTVKVYDEVPSPGRKSGVAMVINRNETLAAQEKQEALQKAFRAWAGKDRKRAEHLEQIYFETYAGLAPGRYDGSFLTLPGLKPEFHPYPHQKNAVARIILEKDVLLNHAVGSGKTGILIMGIHERKRMGLSGKNLVAVPNNVLEAFERTHRFLYPEDRILVIRPEDFIPRARQELLEKVRDEDYTAVYMAFSSFNMIRMSRQYRLEQKAEEIRSARRKAARSPEKWEKRRLETLAERLCDEYDRMQKELPEDRNLPFDALGITTLAVDEAHNYKNISLKSRAEGIVGMNTAGSGKCNELLEKVRFVRAGGGGVIFATGTPLTNSMADLFVLQTYLQPEQMELLHISHFDEWVGSFASKRSGFEVDVDSRNYRIMTRFSRFHNLPELSALFANVADTYYGRNSGLGLPACTGYTDTVVPESPEQAEYIEGLAARTEAIRAGQVDAGEDNLLKVTHDGRAAALDIRLVSPEAQSEPEKTKVFACAQNILRCRKAYPGTAQLVFCDIGTPKKGFNVYDELKTQLVRMGVPEREIAFVHDAHTDAQRRKLFSAVNRAEVTVLAGSTQKLGMGVNVQERLIAVHHLDVPWKPSDMVQREGRLIRQGNTNREVFRFRYITAGTFDAYSWQIVENKQRFIGQFLNGSLADRSARDIDDSVLTYAEIKALSVGDPLLKTRIETGNELERAKIHRRRREQELLKIQRILEGIPRKKGRLKKQVKNLELDLKHFEKNREKLTRKEREAFGTDLLYAIRENGNRPAERLFDTLHGFRILLPAHMEPGHPEVILSGVTENRYAVGMEEAQEAGCIQRIEYLLLHLERRIREALEEAARTEEEKLQAEKEIAKGNPYEGQVSRLSRKLLDIDAELDRRAGAGPENP